MDERVRRRIILRDLAILYVKLGLDGLKDLALMQIAAGAVAWDLTLGSRRRGRAFYAVLRMAERWDLWLNLYGAAGRAGQNADGLFGTSRAGDNTLLGKLEQMVRSGTDPVADAADRATDAAKARAIAAAEAAKLSALAAAEAARARAAAAVMSRR